MMLSVQSSDFSTQYNAIKNCFIKFFKTIGKFLNIKLLSSYDVCLQILRNFIENLFVSKGIFEQIQIPKKMQILADTNSRYDVTSVEL